MKKINQDIEKNEMERFYLMFGEEDYLKRQYRDKLVAALAAPEDTMNVNIFEGSGIDLQSVLDIGDTLPFFADNRVVVLENTGLLKKAPEDLEKRLAAFPDSTHVIFVEKEVDKRNRLYKWLGKNGYASEMNTPDEKMLLAWVKGLCKAEGKRIEDAAVFYFVEHMGTDMLLLKQELEKLFCYRYDEKVITVEDMKAVCISQAADKMFAMLDAIGSHNQDRALLLYHDLLALREPAMRVLYMLTRHFHILMQISCLAEEGGDNKQMASVCKIPPFSVKKYAAQAGEYSFLELRDMVEKCQRTDEGIKTGRVQDIVGVEMLIVEFSQQKRTVG
ncbi:MAG: DNA polymerase III subunit delta [Bacteroidales bacterium]|nr:DNA polymerase III subunit delta [Clostridium sp.]MCM1202568.1 DNA polymerase III subunit delta [Bacteroidales bacterium]